MTADEAVQRAFEQQRRVCGHQIMRPIQVWKRGKARWLPWILREQAYTMDQCFEPPGHKGDHGHGYVWSHGAPNDGLPGPLPK